ncbi:MAG: hypothetical protein CSA49_06180 [Gammaproteobacteria bacterium]|nr:MAG: hypothetical protein CSA49_06180 [Gammaproteobacteria bacterium]
MNTNILILPLLLLIALTINGCAGDSHTSQAEVNYREIGAYGKYNDLPDSEDRRRIEVITSQLGLLSSLGHYEHYLSDETISSIDFSTEQVVMVALGSVTESYDLQLSGIEEFPEYIKLRYTITQPCMECADYDTGRYLMRLFIVQSKKPIFVEERVNILGEETTANQAGVNYRELDANGMYNDLPDSEDRRRIEVITSQLGLLSSLGHYEHYLSDETISSIDFSTEQVVMISLGLVSYSYDLQFSGIEEFPEYIKLRYTITQPCMGCVDYDSGTYLLKLFIIQSKKPIFVEERVNILGGETTTD